MPRTSALPVNAVGRDLWFLPSVRSVVLSRCHGDFKYWALGDADHRIEPSSATVVAGSFRYAAVLDACHHGSGQRLGIHQAPRTWRSWDRLPPPMTSCSAGASVHWASSPTCREMSRPAQPAPPGRHPGHRPPCPTAGDDSRCGHTDRFARRHTDRRRAQPPPHVSYLFSSLFMDSSIPAARRECRINLALAAALRNRLAAARRAAKPPLQPGDQGPTARRRPSPQHSPGGSRQRLHWIFQSIDVERLHPVPPMGSRMVLTGVVAGRVVPAWRPQPVLRTGAVPPIAAGGAARVHLLTARQRCSIRRRIGTGGEQAACQPQRHDKLAV